jgi:hypothetical protein
MAKILDKQWPACLAGKHQFVKGRCGRCGEPEPKPAEDSKRTRLHAALDRVLSVPEKHQLRIAKQTLKYSDAGASIMGGPSKEEAREIILRLTGRPAKEEAEDRRTKLHAALDRAMDGYGFRKDGRCKRCLGTGSIQVAQGKAGIIQCPACKGIGKKAEDATTLNYAPPPKKPRLLTSFLSEKGGAGITAPKPMSAKDEAPRARLAELERKLNSGTLSKHGYEETLAEVKTLRQLLKGETLAKDALFPDTLKGCEAGIKYYEDQLAKAKRGVVPGGIKPSDYIDTCTRQLASYKEWLKEYQKRAKDASPFDRDTDAGSAMQILREKRRQINMTPVKIAEKYGYDLQFVKDVLNGKYGYTETELKRVLDKVVEPVS